MKGLGSSTILLALIIVVLLISVGLMGFVMYHVSLTTNNAKTYQELWSKKKLYMIAPTVMNVLSIALIGVMIVMR